MVELVRQRRDGGGVELTGAGVSLIAALAWAAGAVNAVGYLMLGDVFTSHMTGNASAIVLTVIAGKGGHAVRRLLAFVAFFSGAVAGAVLVERQREHNAAGALWLEAGLLVVATFLALGHAARGVEVVAVAAAMGIQNIALAGSALSAHTTHITGPLTDFAGTAVRHLVGRRQLSRDRTHGLVLYGGRVVAFVAGVASGAALFQAVGPATLVGPAMVAAATGWTVRASLGDRGGVDASQ